MKGRRNLLTPRQHLFVLAYVANCGNATDAAREAGYSEANADKIGHQLLGKPRVAEEIARRRARVTKKLELSAEAVLLGIMRTAYADPRKLFDDQGRLRPIGTLDDDTALAIAGIDVVERRVPGGKPGEVEYVKRVRFSDRTRAQEMLGRTMGLFRDGIGGALNRGGPSNPQQAALRESLDLLSPEQKAQLEAICETIMRGEEKKAHAQ